MADGDTQSFCAVDISQSVISGVSAGFYQTLRLGDNVVYRYGLTYAFYVRSRGFGVDYSDKVAFGVEERASRVAAVYRRVYL